MCATPNIPEPDNSAIINQLQAQRNQNNVWLSNEKVAGTTKEKEATKRNISSLRVPTKKTTDTTGTGANTTDSTTTGLNIPV